MRAFGTANSMLRYPGSFPRFFFFAPYVSVVSNLIPMPAWITSFLLQSELPIRRSMRLIPRIDAGPFSTILWRTMMRLLWRTGHFVRHNVSLERMSQAEHRSQAYTDIDVLALRFDPELTSNVLVADCKSGASAKTFERLFWIAGVMQLSGARRGFFVRTQMTTSRYSDLANQLNITPISLDQLRELEQA